MTDTNSWNNNLVAAFKIFAKYLIRFLLISAYQCKMVIRFNKWIECILWDPYINSNQMQVR